MVETYCRSVCSAKMVYSDGKEGSYDGAERRVYTMSRGNCTASAMYKGWTSMGYDDNELVMKGRIVHGG